MGNLGIPKLGQFELNNENIVASLILLVSFFIIRSLLIKVIRRWSFKDADDRRKQIVTLRNVLFLGLLLGLVFIWGSEIRAFALSLVAVAAALTIATKELILCVMGGMLKYSTRLFEIGDRIEVSGLRGKVVDHNFLTTSLLEIGPGTKSNQLTGRVLKVPNSKYLSESVVVEPKDNEFILMVFKVPLPMIYKIELVEKLLVKAAKEVTEHYYDVAKTEIESVFRKEGVDVPTLEPRVLYDIVDSKSIEFHIRLLVPFNSKSMVEKQLLEAFFRDYDKVYQEIEVQSQLVKS